VADREAILHRPERWAKGGPAVACQGEPLGTDRGLRHGAVDASRRGPGLPPLHWARSGERGIRDMPVTESLGILAQIFVCFHRSLQDLACDVLGHVQLLRTKRHTATGKRSQVLVAAVNRHRHTCLEPTADQGCQRGNLLISQHTRRYEVEEVSEDLSFSPRALLKRYNEGGAEALGDRPS
jgi:hypothetical protein